MIHENILYPQECYQIQGAVYDVYKEMGGGFLEAVYLEQLQILGHTQKQKCCV